MAYDDLLGFGEDDLINSLMSLHSHEELMEDFVAGVIVEWTISINHGQETSGERNSFGRFVSTQTNLSPPNVAFEAHSK